MEFANVEETYKGRVIWWLLEKKRVLGAYYDVINGMHVELWRWNHGTNVKVVGGEWTINFLGFMSSPILKTLGGTNVKVVGGKQYKFLRNLNIHNKTEL